MNRAKLGFVILMGFATLVRGQVTSQTPSTDPAATTLYNASMAGDLNQVKTLIDQGAPIDAQVGKLGFTPLTGAANGHLDVLNFLINKAAKLNLPDFQGSTPLLHACFADSADCALALINAGADVNLASSFGRTPLMFASEKGNDAIVAALIAHKASVDANCSEGPAVLWAASNGHLSTLKLLAAAGANLSLMPEYGEMNAYSIMSRAAANDNVEMIDFLLQQKVNVDIPNADGGTALIAAADYGKAEAAKELLDHGAKVDSQNGEGNTALMLSVGQSTLEAVLQGKPNLEIKNKKGMTALMMAANRNDLGQVHTLVDAGADINATDLRGETALTIGGDIGNTDMVQLLTSKGAKRTDVHVIPKEAPSAPLTAAHSWALSVGIIYPQRFGKDPRVLGYGDTDQDSRRMLKRDWGVTDKASLTMQLDSLRDHGHHVAYQKEGARLSAMSDSDFAQLLTDQPDKAAGLKALRASYTKWKDKTGLAWDLCRAANMVNAGYGAHYFTEDEAWKRLMEIAQTAQGNFDSWQELSDNFLDGREIWANTRDAQFEACAKLLLNPGDPNSPWNQNPWKTELTTAADGT